MKSLLVVLLSLCSPLLSQDSTDYVDVVAPYPNRRPLHDRRAQSFLSGTHSPDSMKMFANMLYNYLKGVTVPHKDEDDHELEEAHLKSRNLELVQDAFEKTSLRHLLTPPPMFEGGPQPILPPPPPPHSFDDYDIGAPGIPPIESDKPQPPPMPKFRPNRFHPEYSTPTPPSSTPPSRVLLFKPSSYRKRPDEFIVRPPPSTRFNTQDGKKKAKSGAAPILSINNMPYRRPFFIPLLPYAPPPYPRIPVTHAPNPIHAYRYRTDMRVEAKRNSMEKQSSTGYVLPPQLKRNEKRPHFNRKSMHLVYPTTPSAMPMNYQKTVPHSSQSLHRRKWRRKY